MPHVIPVSDLKDEKLAVYTGVNETQLKHYYEPKEGLFICESPKVIRRALDAGYEPESFLLEPKYLEGEDADLLQRCEEVPVYAAETKVLSRLTGYFLTGGMLCAMKRKPMASAEELLKNRCFRQQDPAESHGTCSALSSPVRKPDPAAVSIFSGPVRSRIAVLEDIENPTNIGAIFRSAAAMKIDAVLLTEGCSDPLYRRAARVSVGTVFQIPWTYLHTDAALSLTRKEWRETSEQAFLEVSITQEKSTFPDIPVRDEKINYIDVLHQLGYRTAALALSEDSVSIDDPRLKEEPKLAIILGNEGNGLPEKTIAACDYVVKIPMAEGIDSLNVAAASAVAFWELGR